MGLHLAGGSAAGDAPDHDPAANVARLHRIAFNHVVDVGRAQDQIRALLAAGADINGRGLRGETALDEAEAMVLMRFEDPAASPFLAWFRRLGARSRAELAARHSSARQ